MGMNSTAGYHSTHNIVSSIQLSSTQSIVHSRITQECVSSDWKSSIKWYVVF